MKVKQLYGPSLRAETYVSLGSCGESSLSRPISVGSGSSNNDDDCTSSSIPVSVSEGRATEVERFAEPTARVTSVLSPILVRPRVSGDNLLLSENQGIDNTQRESLGQLRVDDGLFYQISSKRREILNSKDMALGLSKETALINFVENFGRNVMEAYSS